MLAGSPSIPAMMWMKFTSREPNAVSSTAGATIVAAMSQSLFAFQLDRYQWVRRPARRTHPGSCYEIGVPSSLLGIRLGMSVISSAAV